MSTTSSRRVDGSRAPYLGDVDLAIRTLVAASLLGSAFVHGTVASEHFGEWVPAGVFFVVLQVVELGLALLAIYAWASWGAVTVVVTGVLTLAVWLLSRTHGMPIGPADFRVPEEIGVPDLACGLLELLSVVAAAVAVRQFARSSAEGLRVGVERTRRGVAVAGTLAAAAMAVTVWGAAPTVLASEGGHHGAESVVTTP